MSASKKIKRLEADVTALHKENDFLSRTRRTANAEIEKLKKQLAEAESNLAEYELPVEKISHKKCQAEMNKLRDQLVKQQNHIFRIDERLRDQQKENRELQAKLQSQDFGNKTALSDACKKEKAMSTKIKDKDTRISSLEQELSKSRAMNTRLNSEAVDNVRLQKDMERLLKSSNELREKAGLKDAKIVDMTSELDEVKKELQEMKKQISRQEKETVDQEVVFEELRGKKTDLEMEETEAESKSNLAGIGKENASVSPEIVKKKKKNRIVESESDSEEPKLKVNTAVRKRKREPKESAPRKRKRATSRMRKLQKWMKHRVEFDIGGKWLGGAVLHILSDTTIRLLLDDGKITDVQIEKLNDSWRWEEDAYYEINKIIAERYDRKRKMKLYKVSWKGFGKEDDSWVEEACLTKAALDDWQTTKKNRRK